MNKLIVEIYHSKAIRSTCKKLAGSDWMDLLHDLIEKLNTKDLDAIHAKGHVLAYANRTAYNMAMDRHRANKHHEPLEGIETAEESEAYQRLTIDDYTDAINAMLCGNRRERILAMVVNLVIEHKSVKEVSRITGVPRRTITNYLHEFRKAANISHFRQKES